MNAEIEARAKFWSSDVFSQETRDAVTKMMAEDPEELNECFHQELEFGTGGLRGLMGVGTNRINIYTIGFATQGLASYVLSSFPNIKCPSVCIAYDSRNNSPLFAKRAAEILAANGIKAFLYSELRPTPSLSFAVRHLGCQAGIVITASHNPKEYNGYKVYWNDGGQLVPPHDQGVINEVRKVETPRDVKTDFDPALIVMLDKEVDEAYFEKSLALLAMDIDHQAKKDLSICYTSLHGTGITMVPEALKRAGFENVHIVEAQALPDGDFPTVLSPNPEEHSAMQMGLAESDRLGADILFGTDPDTDRVGMAVRNDTGKMMLLNGNEAASLLIKFLCETRKEKGLSNEDAYIAKTIVTTELLRNIATHYGVPCHDTLTGFKYIAELIKNQEGKTFIGGGEESYGYLIGDVVRDKDAVISTVMLSEMGAWAKSKQMSPFDLLKQIRLAHGFYKEALISLVKKGISGAKEIREIMRDMRENPPAEIAGSAVQTTLDHLHTTITDSEGNIRVTGLPKSNVLQFILADGSKITARPSGTEPKIKFYISVKKEFTDIHEHDRIAEELDSRIAQIKSDLGI